MRWRGAETLEDLAANAHKEVYVDLLRLVPLPNAFA
jgi:hypothetical protein